MQSTTSLVTKLEKDFPDIIFTSSDIFRWNPHSETVFYDHTSNDAPSLLHETAHALLHHKSYHRDIELLKIEAEAWKCAEDELAPRYNILIDQDIVQNSLDTYRVWLHARSVCPHCQATGLQFKQLAYRCLVCATTWKVNEARTCALRRYTSPLNT